jgi:hypothetical protein
VEAIGSNGRISIVGDNIVISRKGTGLLTALNQGLQGDKTIPIRNITAVQLKEPGLTTGYLRLSINGRDPVGGVREAVVDENAVLFNSTAQTKIFLAFRDELQRRINAANLPAARADASVADELEKLASLKERGFLTDEEFQRQKRRLLGLV